MYNRLVEFAETNEIFYLRQFGFRKNHSTSRALIHLLNKISSAIDQHETTVGIFLDLCKAFDTIIMKFYLPTEVGTLWYPWCGPTVDKKLLFKSLSVCSVQSNLFSDIIFIPYINDLPNASLLTMLVFFILTPIYNSSHNSFNLGHPYSECNFPLLELNKRSRTCNYNS